MTIYMARNGKMDAITLAEAKVDAAVLQALTATMPLQADNTANLVGSMRDGDRS
jgi:hypothetical protein